MSRDLQEILSSGEITEIFKGDDLPENALLTKGEIDVLYPQPVHFAGSSSSLISISINPGAASFFPLDGFFEAHECELFNVANGSVKNTSGRTISTLIGTFNFSPEKLGAGTTTLFIVSERSIDNGFTWTVNTNSLRTFELKKDINQFGTKLSFVNNWLPNELIRFKAYATSSLNLSSPTTTIDGDVVTGVSWYWTLTEI